MPKKKKAKHPKITCHFKMDVVDGELHLQLHIGGQKKTYQLPATLWKKPAEVIRLLSGEPLLTTLSVKQQKSLKEQVTKSLHIISQLLEDRQTNGPANVMNADIQASLTRKANWRTGISYANGTVHIGITVDQKQKLISASLADIEKSKRQIVEIVIAEAQKLLIAKKQISKLRDQLYIDLNRIIKSVELDNVRKQLTKEPDQDTFTEDLLRVFGDGPSDVQPSTPTRSSGSQKGPAPALVQLAAQHPGGIYCDATPLTTGGCAIGIVLIEAGEFAVYTLPCLSSTPGKTHEHEQQAVKAALGLRDAHHLMSPVYTDNQAAAQAFSQHNVHHVSRNHLWLMLAHTAAANMKHMLSFKRPS